MNLKDKKDNLTNVKKKGLKENYIKKFILKYGILMTAIFLIILFSFTAPSFLALDNFLGILNRSSVIGIFALGLTGIVCMANYDIGFAAVGIFCGIINILMVEAGFGIIISLILAILIGCGIYFLYAISVIYIGISAFLGSIGIAAIMTGFSGWITGGGLKYTYEPGFGILGRSMIFGVVPSSIIPFVIVLIILTYLLEFTYIGRYVYSMGANPKAAEYAGIKVRKIKMIVFILAGACSGLAGCVIASQFGASGPKITEGYLFPSIIAIWIGSVYFKEGIPNPIGTIIAAILLSIIENGLLLIGIGLAGREIMQGVVLFIAVTIVAKLKVGGIPAIKIR